MTFTDYQHKRGSASGWAALNPVLPKGLIAIEFGATNKIKIGDGVTAWSDLSYFGGGGVGGTLTPSEIKALLESLSAGSKLSKTAIEDLVTDLQTLQQNIDNIELLPGAQGLQGIQGIKGDTGAKGDTGSQGIQGIQGIPGSDGTQGLKGDTGLQGIQGLTGATGNDGLQGIQGIQGLKGDAGSNGIDGLTTSVNGVTQVAGAITLVKSNIGLANVDDTSDVDKPISTLVQAALNLKATLASPTFVTPALGAATATSINGLIITAGTGTLTIPNSSSLIRAGAHALTLTSTATANATIPAGSTTLVGTTATQTLTGKTITNLLLTAGTTTVSPLKLNSGALKTTPVAGDFEFLTDQLYYTKTTGAERVSLATNKATVIDVSGATYTVNVADTGKTITVSGGTNMVVTLPVASAANIGLTYTFVKHQAATLRIQRGSASDTVIYNQYVESTGVGSWESITLQLISSTQWVSIGERGGWVVGP